MDYTQTKDFRVVELSCTYFFSFEDYKIETCLRLRSNTYSKRKIEEYLLCQHTRIWLKSLGMLCECAMSQICSLFLFPYSNMRNLISCCCNVQVLHACYSKVSPSVAVDDPQLVAWSESVAEILDIDPKE